MARHGLRLQGPRPVLLPVAEWRPDQPDLTDSGTSYVNNVLPRTDKSYGPSPDLSVISSALTARCQGAVGFQDRAGNVYDFAGDASKLYKLTPASTTWTDISKGGGYTTGNTERWSPLVFGNLVIMTNFFDAPQSFDLTSSALFADLAAGAPNARYVAQARGHVILANTNDGTYGARPQRIWWSGQDDATNWPTPGTSAAQAVLSDYQDLSGDFGWIQGVIGGAGTADILVLMERATVRGVYSGYPNTFQFTPAEGVRGCPAPGSIVQVGSLVFALMEDGFYAFNGSTAVPIGVDKIDKTFFADLDQSYYYRISAAADPINKMVHWLYPGSGSQAGTPNRMLTYNWATGRWAQSDLAAELLVRTLSLGYTLESLDAISSSLDALTESLDSRVWTGGRLLLAAFDANHKLNYFTGLAKAAIVDTGEQQPFAGWRCAVECARPIVDGGTPTVAIGTRERQVDAVTWDSDIAIDADGAAWQRAEGRYLRSRIKVPAGSSWTHIAGVELDIVRVGQR